MWFRIPVKKTESLSTLADGTLVLEALTGVLEMNARITSADLSFALDGATPGEGPLQIGVSHGDYSVAEVEENLEVAGLLGPAAKIEQEQSNRLVRTVATFGSVSASEVVNDGKSVKTRLNWLIEEGNFLAMWTYNNSGAPLTTGTRTRVWGHLNGYWIP